VDGENAEKEKAGSKLEPAISMIVLLFSS